MKNIILSAFFILIFFAARTFNYTYTNRRQDIEQGQSEVFKFYDKIYNKKFEELNQMASDTLRQSFGTNGLGDTARKAYVSFGKYINFTFAKGFTQKKEGAINETTYQFLLKVTYEKGILNEVIYLKKFKDGIKITKYEIYTKPIDPN